MQFEVDQAEAKHVLKVTPVVVGVPEEAQEEVGGCG